MGETKPWTPVATAYPMVANDITGIEVRKFALFFPTLAGGGMEKMMLRVAEALVEYGHQVDLVVCRAKGSLLDQIPERVRVVELKLASMGLSRLCAWRADPEGIGALLRPILVPLRPPSRLRHLPDLARYLREERPDALLAASSSPNLQAVWAQRLAGIPTRIVVSQRTTLSRANAGSRRWKHRFLPPLVRRTYMMADAIVAVSEGVTDDLVAHTGILRERITRIYNPVVTPELLDQAMEPLDHPWFKPGEPPVILGTGRLATPKDFPTLLRAFSRVRAEKQARLVILGEGNKRTELEMLARELGVADDVALPGFTTNPYAYMARASVFVLSSAWEGFGNVLVEALACGCPVVSTDCPGGPTEILDGGAYGPLVPVGDDATLANAILATLEAPPAAQRLRGHRELNIPWNALLKAI